jgi:hypothetical protein
VAASAQTLDALAGKELLGFMGISWNTFAGLIQKRSGLQTTLSAIQAVLWSVNAVHLQSARKGSDSIKERQVVLVLSDFSRTKQRLDYRQPMKYDSHDAPEGRPQ